MRYAKGGDRRPEATMCGNPGTTVGTATRTTGIKDSGNSRRASMPTGYRITMSPWGRAGSKGKGPGASPVTARFGAAGTPLADGRGSDRSPDREGGVVSGIADGIGRCPEDGHVALGEVRRPDRAEPYRTAGAVHPLCRALV